MSQDLEKVTPFTSFGGRSVTVMKSPAARRLPGGGKWRKKISQTSEVERWGENGGGNNKIEEKSGEKNIISPKKSVAYFTKHKI